MNIHVVNFGALLSHFSDMRKTAFSCGNNISIPITRAVQTTYDMLFLRDIQLTFTDEASRYRNRKTARILILLAFLSHTAIRIPKVLRILLFVIVIFSFGSPGATS
jgi:hypothetical protein